MAEVNENNISPTLFDLERRKQRETKDFLKARAAIPMGVPSGNPSEKMLIGNINTGIRNEYTGTFPDGTASGELLFPTDFFGYWDACTCNNPFKWKPVEGTEGVFDWDAADYVYDYVVNQNKKPFFYHTLIWGAGQGFPDWWDGLSEEASKAAFTTWLANIAAKFSPAGFNVLNEIADGHQTAGTTKIVNQLGGGDLNTAVSYIFTQAKKYFPDSILYINDFNMLGTNDATRVQICSIINAVNQAQQAIDGTNLIDAVGCQAHYFTVDDLTVEQINTALDYITEQTGLPIHITELDISGNTDEGLEYFTEELQTERFLRIFPTLYNHPNVKRITIWGYLIGETWRYESRGIDTGLVYRNGTGKRNALKWLEKNYLHK